MRVLPQGDHVRAVLGDTHMAKFTSSDFKAMYAGFQAAMTECERVTGRTFRAQRDCAIWVSIAAYDWTDHLGFAQRERAVKEWKVPALRFWPGGQLPAMLAEIDTGARPVYAGTYDGFLADIRAFDVKIAALFDVDCDRDPAKRAKRDRALSYVRAQRYAALAAQAIPERPVVTQVAQAPVKAARRVTKTAQVAIEQTPEFRAALQRAIAELAAAQPPQPDIQMIEREKTMQEFRQYAEAPGRVIPDGATVITGPGGAVYLYEKRGVTGKGKPYVQHYAKAFRPGARRPDWHHVFNSEAERAARAEAFLALVWDRTAVPA